MSIASEINRIKTNIANAYDKAEEKGATMPAVMNSSNLASTIESISGGSDEWKPQPDWWDIDSILENDTEEYAGKVIFLLTDFFNTSTFIKTNNVVKIKTSDNIEYTNITETITHTWDISKDKNCALGYKTRYVIFYFDISDLVIPNNFITSDINTNYMMLRAIFDGTSVTSSMGFSQYYLESLKTSPNVRLEMNNVGFNDCRNLEDLPEVILSNGFYSFASNYKLNKVYVKFKENSNTYAHQFVTNGVKELYILEDSFKNVKTTNAGFNQCLTLKYINNLNFLNLASAVNPFNNCPALVNIEEISNIKIDGFNFSSCILLNHDTLIRILNALYDYSEDSGTHTITLGATNLAKLTEEEIAIGTNKNWTIS